MVKPTIITFTILVLVASAGAVYLSPSEPVRWEHGYKTSRVIATRYKNPEIGYNIGFSFPESINSADRAEVIDFMKSHGGFVVQGGGYPGAEMFVAFKGVNDADSANAKLEEILPDLNKLMGRL